MAQKSKKKKKKKKKKKENKSSGLLAEVSEAILNDVHNFIFYRLIETDNDNINHQQILRLGMVNDTLIHYLAGKG